MTRSYVMSKTVKTKLSKKGRDKCRICHKPVEVGQRIVRTSSNNRTKHFHKKCYDGLLFGSQDSEVK